MLSICTHAAGPSEIHDGGDQEPAPAPSPARPAPHRQPFLVCSPGSSARDSPPPRTPQQHQRIALLATTLLLLDSGAEAQGVFATKALLTNALNEWCVPATRANVEFNYGPVGTWDVSAITDMSELIYGISCKTTFNEDISQWDVAAVTNMDSMVRNRRRDDLA